MIKAIFFDFDGVLTTDPHGSFTTCKNLHEAVPEVPLDHLLACYWEHKDVLNRQGGLHKDIWPAFVACVGKDIDIGLLPEAFRNTPWNEVMLQVCEKLKDEYTLGIITDHGKERFSLLVEEKQLDKLFPIRISSSDYHALKDEPLLFEKALEMAGCRPEECVFIDNHEKNLKVPQQLGFKVFYYDEKKNDMELLTNQLKEWGVEA